MASARETTAVLYCTIPRVCEHRACAQPSKANCMNYAQPSTRAVGQLARCSSSVKQSVQCPQDLVLSARCTPETHLPLLHVVLLRLVLLD
jgi:hypothetical protein